MDTGTMDRGITFEAWRSKIDSATDVDELMKVMRRYLAAWTPGELRLLPPDLAAPALTGREALFARSLMASRAELSFRGTPEAHEALRNMSLTLNAAAARLSFLEAYNALVP